MCCLELAISLNNAFEIENEIENENENEDENEDEDEVKFKIREFVVKKLPRIHESSYCHSSLIGKT